jgi:hypothetical protein
MSRPNPAYLVETNPTTHLKCGTFVSIVTFAPGQPERSGPNVKPR